MFTLWKRVLAPLKRWRWPPKWEGRFQDKKWWSSATISFRTPQGFTDPIFYPRALIDTGSPISIIPGRCPTPPAGAGVLPDTVQVEIPAPSNRHNLILPPRGRMLRFGGIGGERPNRYLFCADVKVEGLEYRDLVNVVFLEPSDLPYPIISLTDVVDAGYTVTFGRRGFRMR